MTNLGKLHIGALLVLQHARRVKATTAADAAEGLMKRALSEYYTNQITSGQLEIFLTDLGRSETKSITTFYGANQINLPKAQ